MSCVNYLSRKIVVSLFDESGNMVRPWAEAGYTCFCFDILNEDRDELVGAGVIKFRYGDLSDEKTLHQILHLNPVILFGFPPCTDLAVSGARHFAAKALKNPNFQSDAMKLVNVIPRLGVSLGCPWMLENPVSVISSLWRKPDHTFSPHEYGRYLGGHEAEHPRWPQYIAPLDAYSKKTCLWTGNGFQMPAKFPVAISSNAQYSRLGGKSAKTKQIRSETPRGFAKAVFLANGRR